MPIGIQYFEPVQFTATGGPTCTLTFTAGPGRTVLAVGGTPSVWDEIAEETFAWVDSPRGVAFGIDPADPTAVLVTVASTGGLIPYLRNAWITYTE